MSNTQQPDEVVSVRSGYNRWALVYDHDANPLPALEGPRMQERSGTCAAWGQLGLHQKPCGLLNVQGYFDRLLSFLNHSIEEGFVRCEYGR